MAHYHECMSKCILVSVQHTNDNIDNCTPVDCDAGGLMCFQGTDHVHFRKKLEHDYYYITLLHYQIIE